MTGHDLTTLPQPGESACVFCSASLGDTILLWPMLRAMARRGITVYFVAPQSRAHLAARCINGQLSGELPGGPGSVATVIAVADTQPWVGRLHSEDPQVALQPLTPPALDAARSTILHVISIFEEGEPGSCLPLAAARWHHNAARLFPLARIENCGTPGSPARLAAFRRWDAVATGHVAMGGQAGGAVVMHIGSGGRHKVWPLASWLDVAERLKGEGLRVTLIAGEVEAERMSLADAAAFHNAGGMTLTSLEELVSVLRSAGGFVGADSGPAHLAAQLGLPTLALFGPTDSQVWSPVGPLVTIIAALPGLPMSSINCNEVVERVRAMLER